MTRPEISAELADVIAYLEQRCDNCDALVGKMPRFEEGARDRKRQLEVMIDEFKAGLHHGCAEARATMLAAKGSAI